MHLRPWLALLALVLANLIWGGSYVAAKVALAELSPSSLAFLRFALAAALSLPLVWRVRGDVRLEWRDAPAVALIGVAGVAVPYLVSYVGMNWTTASDSALVVSAEPVFTVGLAVLFLGEPLGWRRVGALVLGVGGAYTIVSHGQGLASLLVSRQALGNSLVALSLLGEAGYTVLGKHVMRSYRPLVVTLYAVWIAAIILLPVSLITPALTHGGLTPHLVPWRLATWLALLYLSGGCTLGAYLLWNLALSRVQANVAGVFLFLQPVIGALLGVITLHEDLAPTTVVGALAVFGGLLLVSRSPASGIDERYVPVVRPQREK